MKTENCNYLSALDLCERENDESRCANQIVRIQIMTDEDEVQEIFKQYLSCSFEQRQFLKREISSLLEDCCSDKIDTSESKSQSNST